MTPPLMTESITKRRGKITCFVAIKMALKICSVILVMVERHIDNTMKEEMEALEVGEEVKAEALVLPTLIRPLRDLTKIIEAVGEVVDGEEAEEQGSLMKRITDLKISMKKILMSLMDTKKAIRTEEAEEVLEVEEITISTTLKSGLIMDLKLNLNRIGLKTLKRKFKTQ